MSDPSLPDPLPTEGPATPARAASATLRADSGRAQAGVSLDPAQKSLAEALRITFFLVQIGMAVLVVLFLLSGARQVREGERGIKLFLGRVAEQDVQPGLSFAWPYPLGEMITVQTGQASVDIDEFFYPALTPAQRRQPLDDLRLVARMGLKPGRDGAIITGDGNIVHARWSIVYRRQRPAEFVQNVYPLDEAAMVRAAVERGVVRTVAELPIDSFLKQASAAPIDAVPAPAEAPAPAADAPAPDAAPQQALDGEAPAETPATQPAALAGSESTIALRVREIAQRTLDEIGAGIAIEKVVLVEPTPPLSIRRDFADVQAAQSRAEEAREDAERARRERLNAVAGEAHGVILERIDAYESAIELGDEDRAEAILAQIDALLEGEPVEIDGERYERLVSGEAANVISEARQYRTEVVSTTRTAVETFRAKLAQYRASPGVLLNREWTDAYLSMVDSNLVEIMMVPPGTSLEMWLNRDPDIARAIEQLINAQEIGQTLDQRLVEQQRLATEAARRAREQRGSR